MSIFKKIPLKWHTKQLEKVASYWKDKINDHKHVDFGRIKQHCSCFQMETTLYKCLCMWDYYDLDSNICLEYWDTNKIPYSTGDPATVGTSPPLGPLYVNYPKNNDYKLETRTGKILKK